MMIGGPKFEASSWANGGTKGRREGYTMSIIEADFVDTDTQEQPQDKVSTEIER